MYTLSVSADIPFRLSMFRTLTFDVRKQLNMNFGRRRLRFFSFLMRVNLGLFCFSLIELRLSWISVVQTVGITRIVSVTMPRKTARFICLRAMWDYRSTINKILLVIALIMRGHLIAMVRREASHVSAVQCHWAKKIHFYVMEITASNVPMPTPVSPVLPLPLLYTPFLKDSR